MVLSARLRASVLGAACVAGAIACMPKSQPVRARAPMQVALALVNDAEEGRTVEALPEEAAAPTRDTLAARNLEPRTAGAELVQRAFRTRRTTAHRLAALAGANASAELVVLVETKTRFYSQLNGRYRWTVDARISMARRDAPSEAATVEADLPVFLDYDHQREREALIVAGPRIAEEVGRLADDFLGGMASAVSRDVDSKSRAGVKHEQPGSGPGSGSVSGTGTESTARYPDPNPSPFPISGPDPDPDPGSSARLLAGPVRSATVRGTRPIPESVYFVMVDRFANGDRKNDGAIDPKDPQAFHGGDLQGVLDRLDHIQSLGVSTVWLSPVFAMRTETFHGYGAYHGYWTYDFGTVEPRFGDEALLKKLSDELHRRGMKLVLDLVLNHVGPDAPLTREKPEWFHGKGAITDWNDPQQLLTRDVFGLPDLAQERADVYRFLLGHSTRWIDAVEPDGFRLDAARHVPLSFWARFTRDVTKHAGPAFRLYGEMYDGDAVGLSRTLRQAGFDAVFDFPLYFAMNDVFCKDLPPARLASTLTLDRLYEDASRLVTFVDNHDLPRVMSACGGDAGRVAQALAFQLTARGIPSLTYGTEAGLAGAKEPDNRADMVFGADHPLERHVRRLLALRRDHPVFVEGATRIVSLTDDLFAHARVSPDAAALIAVNRGAEDASVTLPPDLAGPATDALTGEPLGAAAVTVPARSVRIALLFPRGGTNAALAAAASRTLPSGFVATGVPAGKGDTVRVVGSAPELGSWDPAKGKLLRRRADGAFVGEVPLAAGAYEWKLAIVDTSGSTTWESGPNRATLVDRAAEIAATWRPADRLGAGR